MAKGYSNVFGAPPYSKSGPATSRDNDALPATDSVYSARGVSIDGKKSDNTDVKRGAVKSPGMEPFAKGTW